MADPQSTGATPIVGYSCGDCSGDGTPCRCSVGAPQSTLRQAVEELAQSWEKEQARSWRAISDRLPSRDYLGAYVEAERAARYEVGAAQLRDILKAHVS